MTDRPITRIVSPEQVPGIVRGTIVGADQRTLVDARPPEMPPAPPMQALPMPCSAAGPRTLLDGVPPPLAQHTAQALYGTHTPQNDARRLHPDQATMLDGVPPSFVSVQSALGHPVREARILPPNQPSIVSGVPREILHDMPMERIGPFAAPPSAAVALPFPPPAAMIRRGHAVAIAVLASLGTALVTGGIVAALYERSPTATPAAQPVNESASDVLFRPRC